MEMSSLIYSLLGAMALGVAAYFAPRAMHSLLTPPNHFKSSIKS